MFLTIMLEGRYYYVWNRQQHRETEGTPRTHRKLLSQDSNPILWPHMPALSSCAFSEIRGHITPHPVRCGKQELGYVQHRAKCKTYVLWREDWIVVLVLQLASWESSSK